MIFIHSFQSEWLKTRRSLAAWLVIIGGFFIPLIVLIGRLVYHDKAGAEIKAPNYWEIIAGQCWQFMSLFLLPMGVILATSLITQIEFRNNAWKQVHASPQGYDTVFLSKLSVILVMLFQFFLLFNLGIYFAGIAPAIVYADIDYPAQAFPFGFFLKTSAYFFLDCLPIVALQYWISLQFKNFLVPLGVGIGVLVASLIAMEWRYGFVVPYTYCPFNFFAMRGVNIAGAQNINIHWWAFGYFAAFTVGSYLTYILKEEKG